MAFVFVAVRYDPNGMGYHPSPINLPPMGSLEHLENVLCGYYGDPIPENIEVMSLDTETGQSRTVRAARIGWPVPEPTPEELEQVAKDRLAALRHGRVGSHAPRRLR